MLVIWAGSRLNVEDRERFKPATFVLSLDMAEPKSIFDMPPDEAEEARLDAIGLAELDAGLGVPHERVREWLAKLGRGEKAPPPSV